MRCVTVLRCDGRYIFQHVVHSLTSDDITMVMVIHEVKFAEQLAYPPLLTVGVVVEEGKSEMLFHNMSHGRTRQFLDQIL